MQRWRYLDNILAEEVFSVGSGHFEVEDVFTRVLFGISFLEVDKDLALAFGALLGLERASELFQNIVFKSVVRAELVVFVLDLVCRFGTVVEVKAAAKLQVILVEAVFVAGGPAVEAALVLNFRLRQDAGGQ